MIPPMRGGETNTVNALGLNRGYKSVTGVKLDARRERERGRGEQFALEFSRARIHKVKRSEMTCRLNICHQIAGDFSMVKSVSAPFRYFPVGVGKFGKSNGVVFFQDVDAAAATENLTARQTMFRFVNSANIAGKKNKRFSCLTTRPGPR